MATVYSLVGSQYSDNWNWPAGDVIEYRMSYQSAGLTCLKG